MPSIAERIVEVRRQERQKSVKDTETIKRHEVQQRIKEATIGVRREQKARDTKRKKSEKINSLYEQSDILSVIKEVQTGLKRGGELKNDLLISSDRLTLELIWGKRYKIKMRDGGSPEVVYDRGLLGIADGILDYNSLSVVINPSKIQIKIAGAESHIIKKDRLSDRTFIEETMFDCFKQPKRVNKTEYPKSSVS